MLHRVCIQSMLYGAILALIILHFCIRNLQFNKSIAIYASSPRVTRGMLNRVEETASDHRGRSHFPDGNHTALSLHRAPSPAGSSFYSVCKLSVDMPGTSPGRENGCGMFPGSTIALLPSLMTLGGKVLQSISPLWAGT